MTTQSHPYHLVNISPWPITSAIGALSLTSGMIKWFHSYNSQLILIALLILLLSSYQWWRDINRESLYQGHHTYKVAVGLRWGMILFIVSEVFFFVSFFWAYFHSSLSPNVEIGSMWPPTGIVPFNPFQIPLLNTTVLLASGVTVTWAHHSLMEKFHSKSFHALLLTIILGLYFTCLQAFEYYEASFSISDSSYGSTFFVATGFHGIHVIIGTSFLTVCFLRHMMHHFSSNHHFGFEAAAWYWHFVDVVWLFLYTSIYWWGS
uniref:Cytochrome c oxidase subunit 3 n=1 Tax=Sphaerotheriidae sp. HYS-2012 TaxID=1170231 RepID=I6PDX5_9MYRI|nr:cytochrome c oxidase subunit III [Sphaerotheriidae sp. HYS-2012]AFH54816.1 cytochrome c oxidase subunit III [Sphaerotheriidae sp. HYS-2012]